jgi:hypothetical protein
MTPKPSFQLCRHRRSNDAACFKLPRCSKCGRVLRPFDNKGWLCTDCRTAERGDDADTLKGGGE